MKQREKKDVGGKEVNDAIVSNIYGKNSHSSVSPFAYHRLLYDSFEYYKYDGNYGKKNQTNQDSKKEILEHSF